MPPLQSASKKEMVTAFRTREILAAARRVMGRRGLDGLTMEEIAQTAGVAKGTVYLYFQSKDELIQALLTQVGENLLRDLEDLVNTAASPRAKLNSVVTLLLGYLERERLLFPAYARDLLRGGGTSPWRSIQEMEEQFLGLISRLFREGIEAGQFLPANPRLLAFLLRGLVRAAGFYQQAEGTEDAVRETLPVLLALVSGGLSRQTPTHEEGAAT